MVTRFSAFDVFKNCDTENNKINNNNNKLKRIYKYTTSH
jgi:hypothetical protein